MRRYASVCLVCVGAAGAWWLLRGLGSLITLLLAITVMVVEGALSAYAERKGVIEDWLSPRPLEPLRGRGRALGIIALVVFFAAFVVALVIAVAANTKPR